MKTETEYKGKWWIPGKSRKKIDGTLFINPNGFGTLELRGVLSESVARHGEPPQYENKGIILGVSSSGSKITLNNCQIQNTSRSQDGFPTQTFEVDTTFIDFHAKTIANAKFKMIRVYFKHLDHLIKNSSVQISLNKRTKKHTVEILNPKPILLFTIDDFNIKIHPTNRFSGSFGASNKIEIKEVSFISIESKKKDREYEDYLKLILKIQTLLTFCLSKPTYPTKLSGESSSSILIEAEGNNAPFYTPINIITHWNDLIDPTDSDFISPDKIVFTFNNIQKQKKTIMRGWFKTTEEYNSIFELYFATMFNSKMYLQNIYLTLAQCIESYHRKSPRYPDYLTDPDEYAGRVEVVKDALKKHSTLKNSQIKSIISWLKTGNRPSLENRIDAILKTYSLIAPIIKGHEVHFAKTIADNRNHLTHLDPKPGATYATFEELYYLSLRMRLLLITIILDEIGFLQEEIKAIIVRISGGFRLP
jgi:hypothetical protein